LFRSAADFLIHEDFLAVACGVIIQTLIHLIFLRRWRSTHFWKMYNVHTKKKKFAFPSFSTRSGM